MRGGTAVICCGTVSVRRGRRGTDWCEFHMRRGDVPRKAAAGRTSGARSARGRAGERILVGETMETARGSDMTRIMEGTARLAS